VGVYQLLTSPSCYNSLHQDMYRNLSAKVILLLALSFTITLFLRKLFNLDFETVRVLVASYGIWAPIIYGLILFLGLTVPFNPVSDLLTVSVAAFLFPAYQSVIATFLAHCSALFVNYWIGSKYANSILKKLITKSEAEYLQKLAKKLSTKFIFGIRFVLPSSTAFGVDIVSYVAGLQYFPFLKFFLASIIPWTILNVIYFYSTSFFRQQSLVLFFLPAILIATVPLVVLYFKKKPNKGES